MASILTFLGSAGLASIVVAILKRKWDTADREDEQGKDIKVNTGDIQTLKDKQESMAEVLEALVQSQKTMMAHQINTLGESCIYGGGITLEHRKTIEQMYAGYLKLPGANGLCGTTMEEVRKLPTVESWQTRRKRERGNDCERNHCEQTV